MSHQLINRSPDLKRLRDDGYDIEIRAGHLLLKNVPYVNSGKEIRYGILVSELTLAGDVTTTPSTHVINFAGEHPCNTDGSEIAKIKNQSGARDLGQGLLVNHAFSSKPLTGQYVDYYEKMTIYAAIISSQAEALDGCVTPRTFPVITTSPEESMFMYMDTSSSRAGIGAVTQKLEIGKIGIVGLGGTGSYVLDLVAKTPVREIHLFDGDKFSQHNAFRSPGAPSTEELAKKPQKVHYFQELYSKMRRGIVAHDGRIDVSNVDQLAGMDFVFLCLDHGASKKLVVEFLNSRNMSYIDVGMGVQLVDGALLGVLRVTASTADQRQRMNVKNKILFNDSDQNNDYNQNIQIADLNSLNATLAVIKWKKLSGFYLDLEKEYFSAYSVDGNALTNEDQL